VLANDLDLLSDTDRGNVAGALIKVKRMLAGVIGKVKPDR
jgi:hypothetical protein